MRVLYFDTETTGLHPDGIDVDGVCYPGQVCQLAYLLCEGDSVTPYNYYFSVQYIEPAASAITGLTVPGVYRLSGGRVFADDAPTIARHFAWADVVVAHNLYFDQRFMANEFLRVGMPFDLADRGFCSMRALTPVLCLPGTRSRYKWPSLAELAAYFGVQDADVQLQMQKFYGRQCQAHDARFDTVKMYLALQKAAHIPIVAQRLGLTQND